jgi:hypothetical protein
VQCIARRHVHRQTFSSHAKLDPRPLELWRPNLQGSHSLRSLFVRVPAPHTDARLHILPVYHTAQLVIAVYAMHGSTKREQMSQTARLNIDAPCYVQVYQVLRINTVYKKQIILFVTSAMNHETQRPAIYPTPPSKSSKKRSILSQKPHEPTPNTVHKILVTQPTLKF